MNLKDQIKQVARLEEVVERYLLLKRGGSSTKTLVGLCPFHDDRHPSLHVNVEGQYYKCFACGEGGDLFQFVQQMEGCDFRQTLKILAGWYGLSDTDDYRPVKYPPVRKKSIPVVKDKPELVSPMHITALLRNHRMVLDLLEKYVPEEDNLRETYSFFEVGVASYFLPPDYAKFCNRLIFPIRNEQGKLVAFAGRYRGETEGTDIRKYVNSSTSPVYHKSEILYGLYQAQDEIRKHKFVYITEGYKDVLAMHAAGFRNTVALCGTTLTEQHAALLYRYTQCAIVMLDGDEAGQVNEIKSAWLLSGKGFSVGRIILEPKHDPDSLLRLMGDQEFTGYIKKVTRFSRLEIYEADLLRQIKQLLSDLQLALTVTERTDLFVRMIPLHKRLSKVTTLLAHSSVLKTDWFINL
ncbi:DNA primase [Parabacteroides gordonii]|jgi:DNA primase|uniref:DNA primase n=1 Tax=Parabacteroides gordonii MS-1 = DSM 23371 TaxID=1203610 RepID=A0A0F5IVB7_9BACT|nr:CHC2 zinc finger domain-containing protein [Parabacteroides gordonii]KKB49195.1 DNA primase [Parabacteroides gordonii MS-1 = DSM 23371]MCA5585466.1 toprim domain-containing protein [Parabacteroides gordonii]RGP16763.1 toprim domain-containing protein [Parabacteroides gordonii]